MEKNPSAPEYGVLELLIVVIQHVKLLVLLPLAVGAVVFSLGYLKQPSYTSESILAMAEAMAKEPGPIIVSPLVIDPVIEKLNLAKDIPLTQARDQMVSQVSTKVGRGGLFLLNVSADSPARAQLLGNTLIDAWLATTLPGDDEKARLQERLTYVQKMLKLTNQALERVTSESPSDFDGAVSRGDRGMTLVSLGELQAKYFSESQVISRALQGVSRDLIRQRPSLAILPDPAVKSIRAVLMTVVTFLLLLIGVMLKHLITRFTRDARNGAKITRLRAAFGFADAAKLAQPATPGA
jgi:hypothetical protein